MRRDEAGAAAPGRQPGVDAFELGAGKRDPHEVLGAGLDPHHLDPAERGGSRRTRIELDGVGRAPAAAPLMVTSRITRLTPAARIGSQSTSLPTSATSFSILWIVDAMVNSRTGAPSAAPGDEQAGGSGGEVARDRVDAGVDAGHVVVEHAVVDAGDQLGLAAGAGRDLQGDRTARQGWT